jgi:PAS domain
MDARLSQIADRLMKFKSANDVHPRSVGAALLPHLFILGIEKHNNAPRLRVRLIGTSLQQFFGRSLRDHYMEDFIHGPRAAEVIAGFHKVALSHSPLWMRQLVQVSSRVPRFVEGVVVYLPPARLYGGLVAGELATHPGLGSSTTAIFESRVLTVEDAAV